MTQVVLPYISDLYVSLPVFNQILSDPYLQKRPIYNLLMLGPLTMKLGTLMYFGGERNMGTTTN